VIRLTFDARFVLVASYRSALHRPASDIPGLSMNLENEAPLLPLPEMGQIVQVRTRKFLVDRVEPASGGGGTLVGLLCLDDDAQGYALDVAWEECH
jgi:hypothetical protein